MQSMRIKNFACLSGTSCPGLTEFVAWCHLRSLPKMLLEPRPSWRDTRLAMGGLLFPGVMILLIDACGDFFFFFFFLPHLGAPHRDWCKSWHFPGLWTLWTAAAGSWALCQSWNKGKAGHTRPGTCQLGKGLGAAQDDAGSVLGTPGNLFNYTPKTTAACMNLLFNVIWLILLCSTP